MTESDIERLAQEVLDAHVLAAPPVNPCEIARIEKIHLLPGTYDGCFDGRIAYRKRAGRGRFYLFYAEEEPPWRPKGRVRFSVAHELAHYYLPHHRRHLLAGATHGSQEGFVSDKSMEREADLFAAALLMPCARFIQEVERRSGMVCTLAELSGIAHDVFWTSFTSTVVRYVLLGFEACCAVMSKHGRVCGSFISPDMRGMGLSWIGRATPLPSPSIIGQAISGARPGHPTVLEGLVDSRVWFDRGPSIDLWEETRVLGRTGVHLTFLAVHGDS